MIEFSKKIVFTNGKMENPIIYKIITFDENLLQSIINFRKEDIYEFERTKAPISKENTKLFKEHFAKDLAFEEYRYRNRNESERSGSNFENGTRNNRETNGIRKIVIDENVESDDIKFAKDPLLSTYISKDKKQIRIRKTSECWKDLDNAGQIFKTEKQVEAYLKKNNAIKETPSWKGSVLGTFRLANKTTANIVKDGKTGYIDTKTGKKYTLQEARDFLFENKAKNSDVGIDTRNKNAFKLKTNKDTYFCTYENGKLNSYVINYDDETKLYQVNFINPKTKATKMRFRVWSTLQAQIYGTTRSCHNTSVLDNHFIQNCTSS